VRVIMTFRKFLSTRTLPECNSFIGPVALNSLASYFSGQPASYSMTHQVDNGGL
jgi:hypothetical protein